MGWKCRTQEEIMFKRIHLSLLALFGAILLTACTQAPETDTDSAANQQKIGVLLVNHGSHSEKWRNQLLDMEKAVAPRLLSDQRISAVKTAFMEYTEPSIATRMKEFDEQGFDEVIVVPIFLTISSHSAEDIPVIVGIKSNPKVKAELAKEEIETYRAKARVTITPLLDFTTLLKKNVYKRVKALDEKTDNTGVVLVAYGDAGYNEQWEAMVEEIGRFLKVKGGIDTVAYAWCGHLVDYSPEPTTNAIHQVLEMEDRAFTIPLLVAFDPDFQIKIIQKGVDNTESPESVLYKPDAILPDENLNDWVVDITTKTIDAIAI